MKFSGKRAQGFVWLFVIVMLFVIACLYLILDKALVTIVGNLGQTIAGTQFEATGNQINFIWGYFLALVVLILVIWAVTQAMRRPQFS